MSNTDELETRESDMNALSSLLISFEDPSLDAFHKEWEYDKSCFVTSYEIKGRTVQVVGVAHTRDAQGDNMASIVAAYRDFASAHSADSGVLLLEGFHAFSALPVVQTFDSGVTTYVEMGGILYLAQQDSLQAMSPEVSVAEVVEKHKENGIPPSTIATYYLMRSLSDLVKTKELDDYVLAGLVYDYGSKANVDWLPSLTSADATRFATDEQFRDQLIQDILSVSIPKINEVTHSVTGSPLINEDTHELMMSAEELDSYHQPGEQAPATLFRDISRADNNMRDIHLINEIVKQTQEDKDVLVVFGGTHAFRINPVLQHLENK
ncbi:hypothetical protein KC980_03060 [candidate division WWE3 bacterium]|uniref:Uncharacterized protein n=1 Tax=candidate division WWE3 bacterium TaxID=2053526 RepID=A0A955EBK5_UNCKA|nr:hypothetical protein [candidate division WWE3 bacterium]